MDWTSLQPERLYLGSLDPRNVAAWEFREPTEEEQKAAWAMSQIPQMLSQAKQWDAQITAAEARGVAPSKISKARGYLDTVVNTIARINSLGKDLLTTIQSATGSTFGATIETTGLSGYDWNRHMTMGILFIGGSLALTLAFFPIAAVTGIFATIASLFLVLTGTAQYLALAIVALSPSIMPDGTTNPGPLSFSGATPYIIGGTLIAAAFLLTRKARS
jgi:hypothetical protein